MEPRMNRLIINSHIVATSLAAFCIAVTTVNAQMGLRENELFSPRAFASAGPAIGSVAPKLDLTDLAGKPVTLDSYRGKVVVLVKGGYT